MRRREFIAGLSGAVAWPFTRPLAAEAQRRVGVLSPFDNDPRTQSIILGPFWEGLARSGWVEGRNLRIDYHFAGGDPSRLAAYAEELVNLRPDVILAYTTLAAQAVQQYTSVIPIVGTALAGNLVRNEARPEGNMTGFVGGFGSLVGKWLELFKEAVPRLTRVADFFPARAANNLAEGRATVLAAAAQLGVTLTRMPFRYNAVEIDHAIGAFAAEPDGGLLLTGTNPTTILEVIERLVLSYHLPLMYGGTGISAERYGILLAHGPDSRDLSLRASSYVDRILRGAKPGELPVQYPTKFELVVNLKTAKAIGVTIPEAFLAQADQVIE
jgi:putative ABC transport system substrate-binding protein